MNIELVLNQMEDYHTQEAIIWQDRTFTYQWLMEAIRTWQKKIVSLDIAPGKVVMLKADFSPNAAALFFALAKHKCIIVPLTSTLPLEAESLIETAQCEYAISIDGDDQVTMESLDAQADHELYNCLKERSNPGLVLFSSGSTGPSKAALHDLNSILDKFKVKRKALRSISFLLYDHIGGINTMLYLFANGGCLITIKDRTPDTVLEIIEKHKVELLPTSPTFINLILLSDAYQRYNLSSLKLVTYGTEPMPESTLKRFHAVMPHVELRQTYGLSEIGIMQSKSKSSDSLWLKVGGDGYQTRVIDGILHIKAHSAMLGYLNYPSPFTMDGWLVTGDRVEQNGEYIRFLGRDSEIINVGGEKVFPVMIENVLQTLDNVAEVSVYGSNNPITGQIVCADVRLNKNEEKKAFVKRLKSFCRKHLQPFMTPVKINLVSQPIYSARFKKVRRRNA